MPLLGLPNVVPATLDLWSPLFHSIWSRVCPVGSARPLGIGNHSTRLKGTHVMNSLVSLSTCLRSCACTVFAGALSMLLANTMVLAQEQSAPAIDRTAAATHDPVDTGSQAPARQEPERKPEPFAFADFTWLTGNPRTREAPLDTK